MEKGVNCLSCKVFDECFYTSLVMRGQCCEVGKSPKSGIMSTLLQSSDLYVVSFLLGKSLNLCHISLSF